MRNFFSITILLIIMLPACKTTSKNSKSIADEVQIPKRDFLVLRCDTGVLKLPERFNVENLNEKVNFSAFLENRYLFQINGIPEAKLRSGEKISGSEFDMIIVRPPNKPCVCLDRNANSIKRVESDKRSAVLISGKITCDGILFEVSGAFTGVIPQSTSIITE
jgi:hypothetical protein